MAAHEAGLALFVRRAAALGKCHGCHGRRPRMIELSLWDADMIRELIVGARAWSSAVMPPQGNELARLSSRNRPGHNLDAGYPVRCRADAGRESRSRNLRRFIRRPAWSSTIPKTSGRRRSPPCARQLRGQGLTPNDIAAHRHHQPARDRGCLGAGDRPPDPQCHRLAGSAHGGCLRRTAAGRARAGDHGAHRPRARSRIFRPPRSPGCSTTWKARVRRRRRAGLPSGRWTVSCCGGSPAARCMRPMPPMRRVPC